jgi:opacity protein-like surface antigen
MKTMIAAAVAALGLSSAAIAADTAPEKGFYLGGVYSFVDYKEDGFDTVSPKAIAVLGGWNFNKNFALEARLGTGAGSDSMQGIDFEVDSYLSILFRGTLPVNDVFSVYAVAGHTNGKLKASFLGESFSDSDSSFSYGIGGEFNVASRSGISLEWSRLLSGDDYDVDALSIGYRYRF